MAVRPSDQWYRTWASSIPKLVGGSLTFLSFVYFWQIVAVQWLSPVWLFVTHGLQHARLPCPLLSPGVCLNSCPLSWWYHPTVSSSVTLFSSCPQSLPASEFFPMSWPFASGSQSIGASASASVLPMNIQGWFPLGLTGLISLLPQGFSSLLQHHSLKAPIFWHSAFLQPNSYTYVNNLKKKNYW